jgi:hypothetical protein
MPTSEEAAQKRGRERASIERSLLDASDYAYFVVYMKEEQSRRVERSVRAPSVKEAKETAKRLGGRVERRIKKSGCRKLADFYGLSLPEHPIPEMVEVVQIGSFIFQKERGAGFIAVKVMTANALSMVKAEYTIAVKAADGRMHAGVGACAVSDGRGFGHPDHDIPATAWTRAYNRAIMDSLGWGSISAEESDPSTSDGGSGQRAPKEMPVEKLATAAAPVKTNPDNSIQRTQLEAVRTLAKQIGMTDQALDEAAMARHKRKVAELSRPEGTEFIAFLLSVKSKRTA